MNIFPFYFDVVVSISAAQITEFTITEINFVILRSAVNGLVGSAPDVNLVSALFTVNNDILSCSFINRYCIFACSGFDIMLFTFVNINLIVAFAGIYLNSSGGFDRDGIIPFT